MLICGLFALTVRKHFRDFRSIYNISTATRLLVKETLKATSALNRPERFIIDGLELVPDENWNVSAAVLEMLNRRLLYEDGNPLRLLKQAIVEHFNSKYRKEGNLPLYTVCETEPRAVSVWDNFDSLLTPLDHVSRRPSDTYYINKDYCLRAHTTAHESKLIKQGLDSFLTVGDVYRRDQIDKSHYPCFHQLEGVRLFSVDELFGTSGIKHNLFENGTRTPYKQEMHSNETARILTLRLKNTLEQLSRHLFGTDVKMRWVETYFPFTHPSFELEIFFEEKWLEVLGCGVLEQKIVDESGSADKVGFAFGLGLERLAMVLYGIPDIRLFWSRDSGFLSQFKGKTSNDIIKYVPISVHPQVYFDLSFWLPDNISSEDMTANAYDAIRSLGGSLVEQVNITDTFKHKKTGRLSQTYRLVYRSATKALTKEECNVVHKGIASYLEDKYSVQISNDLSFNEIMAAYLIMELPLLTRQSRPKFHLVIS